jgi:3-hydroxy-9,10-secoandrosta-1,3,5(10)-triene-9,17-dione monooxygenase
LCRFLPVLALLPGAFQDRAFCSTPRPNLHAYAERGETPPLDERLRYKFQSTAVTERCTLLAARIFKATGAAGLTDELPFGGILADLTAGRQHISNQFEYVGSSWGGVMFGMESKDLMV